MNEQIRQLALLHGYLRWDQDSQSYELDGDVDALYAFAELIVRQCAELVKDQLKVIPTDQKDWDGHNYGYTAAVYESLDRFKEHFGVE